MIEIDPAIELLATRIVQEAPAIDRAVLGDLLARLAAIELPLARSIARVYELTAEAQVSLALALPHLAMACATLCDPRSTERELAAAQYEIDTLLPVPAAPRDQVPDVAVGELIRGPRRRT
ncbi:MAG: hypothetical protein WKG01_28435 [Kofleriaceae bacterium]